jgi:FKBP-type peptidyl-prolyl cis-trans isomerase
MSSSRSPKTGLDKIIHAIRQQPQGPNGTSRVSIAKYLKSELNFDNPTALKAALKKGVSSGKLEQVGQSFRVKGDAVTVTTPDEDLLGVLDIKEGKGAEAKVGDTVVVKYVGKLDNGYQFDAANKFDFCLGAGDVIKGWDQGVVGMKVGGIRNLVVPSKLGYGKRGCSPDIPPNATLQFEVTLKKIN